RCLAPLGALCSFPTRRASDLRGMSLVAVGWGSSVRTSIPERISVPDIERRPEWTRTFPPRTLERSDSERRLMRAGFVKYQMLPRSEEHTSELQSRVDLVCRLL